MDWTQNVRSAGEFYSEGYVLHAIPVRGQANKSMSVLPTLHTRLSQKSKSNGAPTLIFIASAALRVADVTRVLKDKKLRGDKGGEVAKLFAKHFKLEEHVAYMKRTKVGTAVGTPGRIGKLLCDTGERPVYDQRARNANTDRRNRRNIALCAHTHNARCDVPRYEEAITAGHTRDTGRSVQADPRCSQDTRSYQAREDPDCALLRGLM